MAQEVVSDVVINYKSVGLDKVGSEIKQTSVALDGLVIASTNAEKATASLENRFKGLERSFGTTEGQAAKFAKVQDNVNKAVEQNPALMERGNQILRRPRNAMAWLPRPPAKRRIPPSSRSMR